MKPTRPINVTGNPNWRYSASTKTDVGATIRRIRRDQELAKKAAESVTKNVVQLGSKKP